MQYSEILRNPHFNNLAAVIRVPFLSQGWRKRHATVPFWLLIEALQKAIDPQLFNKERALLALTDLLIALTMADGRLAYSEDDLNWIVEVLDRPRYEALAILSMFTAWFSAPDTLVTPTEIAEATGTHESGWRNKAAAGEIPGAIKKGKQWLLPLSVVRTHVSPEQAARLQEAGGDYDTLDTDEV